MAQLPVIFLAFANERESEARYLRGLPREQALIKQALEPAVDAGLCELVVESNATLTSILNIFQKAKYKDRIAIFHYGGHADGYQLLLETLEGDNEIAHGGGLVSFLAGQQGLKNIFLNGCSTQQQTLELIEAGVPSVIGTSQAISDNVAQKLAVRFYQSLANGATLQRSWKEAIDEVQMLHGGGNTRSLYLEDDEVEIEATHFPWDMYVREGSEIVNEWNLPEAVDNPLFGLPELPLGHLPNEPFRFLQRYHREHAEIFFGRSYAIRELYDRATDPTSSPVILLYGQSGVGKSSMLDAGVLPRLEQVRQVIYVRRDPAKGLKVNLMEALAEVQERGEVPESVGESEPGVNQQDQIQQLQALAETMDDRGKREIQKVIRRLQQPVYGSETDRAGSKTEVDLQSITHELLRQWKQIEQNGKPLVLILDQVEEVYTQARPHDPNELEVFLAEVRAIFGNPASMPKGKLILSYRKEYNPEIEEACKKFQIPRDKIFLRHLERKDIIEVIEGLSKSDRLRAKYRLRVESALPGLIADDLLEDKDSPIAPVLQILLTKMWQLDEGDDPYFSVAKYQQLKLQGILMGDFLDQQLEKLHEQMPEVAESGMALDVLYQHTTVLGTAATRERDTLDELYQDRPELLSELIQESQTLFLLSSAGYRSTALAHDTLAPLVQQRFRESDSPGQRAARILQNKVVEFQTDPNNTLDEADLSIVEAGVKGIPVLNDAKTALIKASLARRAKAKRQRRNLRIGALAAVGVIVLFGIFALIQRSLAERNAEIAEDEAQKAKQEKAAADIARGVAEQQTLQAISAGETAFYAQVDAEEQACIAEEERLNALRQEAEARRQAEEARRQRDSAEQARYAAYLAQLEALAQADTARMFADSANFSRFRALAKTVASKAIQVEDPDLKQRLAALAFTFNQTFKGDPSQPDVYLSMYQSLKAERGNAFNLHRLHEGGKVAIRALAFDPSGTQLYSTGSDGRLLKHEWQGEAMSSPTLVLETSSLVNRAVGIGDEGIVIARTQFSPDNNPIGRNAGQVQGVEAAYDLAFIPNSQTYIAIGQDRVLRKYEAGEVDTFAICPAPSKAIAISPDGKQLAAALEDGRLMIWDLTNGDQPPRQDYRASEGLSAVAFSQSKRGTQWLAYGDIAGRVYLRNLTTHPGGGTKPKILGLHKDRVSDLAFRPDNAQLASSSWDKSVSLWNLNKLNQLPIQLTDHPAMCWSLAYSPIDGGTLMVGLGNGAVKRWPTSSGTMWEGLCDQVSGEYVSRDEWTRYVGFDMPEEFKGQSFCE